MKWGIFAEGQFDDDGNKFPGSAPLEVIEAKTLKDLVDNKIPRLPELLKHVYYLSNVDENDTEFFLSINLPWGDPFEYKFIQLEDSK